MQGSRIRAGPMAWLLLAACVLGCEDADRGERERLQRQLETSRQQADRERQGHEQQLQEERRKRHQDRRVLEARRQELASDAAAAIGMWLVAVAGLIVVAFLALREARLRRCFQRLLVLLLGSDREGRAP